MRQRDSRTCGVAKEVSKYPHPLTNPRSSLATLGSVILMADNAFKLEIWVSFPSQREAEIAYQVLVVDKEPPRSQVLKLLNLENKRLKIQFTAPTPHQLKIGVNGFLDHLMLVCETMVHFGPPGSF